MYICIFMFGFGVVKVALQFLLFHFPFDTLDLVLVYVLHGLFILLF